MPARSRSHRRMPALGRALLPLALGAALAGSSSTAWAAGGTSAGSGTSARNHAPAAPSGLTTSPQTSCSGAIVTVGDGEVSLHAVATDRDGDALRTSFSVTKAATGAVVAGGEGDESLPSGSTAQFVLAREVLDRAAGGAVTTIAWRARASDGRATGPWSKTCRFAFDPTRPDAPTVSDPGGEVVGRTSTFTITPPATGVTPSSYTCALNADAPVVVPARGKRSVRCTVRVTQYTNRLTVTSLSAGGNVGGNVVLTFSAAAPPVAVDGDLDGDGHPDLVTVGGGNGLPSGLWWGAGQADGRVSNPVTDLAPYGVGSGPDGDSPASFDGRQIVTGHFTGSGPQDVLAYSPTDRSAVILVGNGDGSLRDTRVSGGTYALPAGFFTDENGDDPLQLATADMSGRGLSYPDLIGVSGSSTSGYHLAYYPMSSSPGTANWDFATLLSTPTPTGGSDWEDWTLATARTASGTAVYLWNRTTHALYLWPDPHYDYDTATFTPGTQYAVSTGFDPGPGAALRAADLDGDGTADLWATTSGPAVTAYLATRTAGSIVLVARPTQTLSAASAR
jgi:hypothetical protein